MQVGRRLTQVTILSGSVVRVWGTLESILERNEHSLSKSDRTMRVVRVELEADRHLVGVSPACYLFSYPSVNMSCSSKLWYHHTHSVHQPSLSLLTQCLSY